MKNVKGFTTIELFVVIFVVVGVIGWVMNIIKLINAPEVVSWTVLEILRVVGIFLAPLGAILGWF